MYVDNITSDAMVLNYNGKAIQIKVYEDLLKEKDEEIERLHSIIKEVREYVEENWISQKDADNYRFDDEELNIEISDIAVLFDVLDKEVN